MCLSPQVDLVAGTAISIFAFDALRNNPNIRTLPIAVLPTLFAIHTFTSAFVWLGQNGDVSNSVESVATDMYIYIAFVGLPIIVPIATWLIEPPGWRRFSLAILSLTGLLVGGIFWQNIAAGKSSVVAGERYIDFHVEGVPFQVSVLYIVVTCGAMLLSGSKPLFYWGMLNVLAVAFLSYRLSHSLPSLWCFWAACTSGFISWFIRSPEAKQPSRRHSAQSLNIVGA
jgi:hypothetical protein